MNPQNEPNQYNPARNYDHSTLPPPIDSTSASTAARTAFPPLGTTLPAYSPQTYSRPAAGAPTALYPPKKRAGWKKWLKRVFITLLVVGLLAGGYDGAKFLINASKSLGGNLFGLIQNDKLNGEDTGRVNILLAGNSADDVGHSGGDLTDSIMIVSLDTKNNTAFLLSVPRDLWVNIPGSGYSKINAAYVYGKADKFSEPGYPDGGMGLLEKVIEQNMDIDINYYALVNYTALRDAVNAVGGIDVNIQSSDPRGLYDPSRDWTGPRGTPLVKLTNGVHTLNGQQALNLARARGDTYGSYGFAQSDFTRTANQRLMLTAIKDKATSAGVVSNPIKIGSLLDSFGNNVQTDFKTTEVRRLVELSQKIPNSSITSASLNDANGKNLLTSYRTYNGQSALIPAAGVEDYTAIIAYLNQLMAPPAATTTKQ
jgi:LCP family protein required for cell wall assembly